MAPDASSVRFRNGGRTSPVAGDQNNHSKDSSGGCGGTTNNVMAVTAELTLPPSSSYNHQQSNNGSHQLIDGDTCPQCCSPSAKTSFMTFEELADINNIVVAKSPNWFIIMIPEVFVLLFFLLKMFFLLFYSPIHIHLITYLWIQRNRQKPDDY